MGGGQDKPAWTACPPGVKITRVGGKITRDSLPPGGQAVQGGKINCYTGSDRFIVCKTDLICIKRIFFGPKKTHFADHILAQFPGLVKCQTVNCPQLFQLSMLSTHYWIVKNKISQ